MTPFPAAEMKHQLDMGTIYSYGIILCLVLGFIRADEVNGCKSPQYLETGKQGTVTCSFDEDFFSVYWYDSKNYVTADAIIEYQNSVKRGKGFESGEFDVHQDGSLIINNVSLEHDHYFSALELRAVDNYKIYNVRVFAIVKPLHQYPVIENCEQDGALCFKKLSSGTRLICSVRDSRPSVDLTWISRTANGDKNVSYEFTTTTRNLLKTSVATINDPLTYSSGINLLLCKAQSLPKLLVHDESLIIIESDIRDLNLLTPILTYTKKNSRLNLSCSENEMTFLVWKYNQKTNKIFTEIAYGVYWQNYTSTFSSSGYNLSDAGVLFIPEVRPEHEGQYACISSTGTGETIVVYDITVYVSPDPAFPVVEGCTPDRYCVLDVGRQGVLKCTVKGVRPKVVLSWKTFYDRSSSEISFQNQETTFTSKKDDTFDVLLTAQYDAARAKTKLTIECVVSGKEAEVFPLTTKLDLLFIEDIADTNGTTVSDTTSKETDGKQKSLVMIIILAVVFAVIILALVAFLLVRGRCFKESTPQTEDEKDANIPMLHSVSSRNNQRVGNLHNGKDALVMQLKSKYADLTAAVYPVPYLHEKIYSVDDVFIESGFDFQMSGGKWKSLESYDKIFSDSKLTSSRRIIEGEAGYGKSTLSLKFAYDWCNNVEGSPLNQKEIFILLQLRQLGGVKSIFDAIKQCLLPKDTHFTSTDIERILQESKSVLVVLDGYDEYPDQNKGTDSFVIKIIKKEILQQFEVILTTRSAYLPLLTTYSPGTTRLKLNGFNDGARESYLRKVLVGDDNEAVGKVKEKMGEYPFLEDICKVPLFYVLFAHLSTMEGTVLKFNSVTVFFRHIISCFHSHGKNKITDLDEKTKFELFEETHHALDEVAFEGLSGESQQLIWERDFICKKLGIEFYKQYISIGVLVDEEVRHILDDPGHFSASHIQYRQEVRFYHKLFCEWYAAHFLANYAARPEVSLDPRNDEEDSNSQEDDIELEGSIQTNPHDKNRNILKNLHPANVEYLYRFACGLNAVAAEKIYQYVTSKYGGDKFVILCLVEQSGKLDKIKPTIEKLCASTVMFHHEHSLLLQRSTIQILEIASLQQIPIAHLWLCNCFKEVSNSGRSLLLTSGVKIRQIHTLSALDIRENDREITERATVGIIKYCIQSRKLITLKFKYCLMPWSIDTEKVNASQEKKVTVLWDTGFASSFKLNLENGSWEREDGSRPLTQEEYNEEADAFRRPKS